MEPLILATGILIGSAVSHGAHDHHRHRRVQQRVHYHSAHCPDTHFRTSITYRSPRPRYRYYKPRLRSVGHRRHHYHRSHKPSVRRTVRYKPHYRTRTTSSRRRLRKI